jgi:hypothetical protein
MFTIGLRALVLTAVATMAAAAVSSAPAPIDPPEPPEAGPYPVDPPYVDPDDAGIVDAATPFCDGCATRD